MKKELLLLAAFVAALCFKAVHDADATASESTQEATPEISPKTSPPKATSEIQSPKLVSTDLVSLIEL